MIRRFCQINFVYLLILFFESGKYKLHYIVQDTRFEIYALINGIYVLNNDV